jgi:MFS transporter, Spinster family, sphingosine-1-phosphate transporter
MDGARFGKRLFWFIVGINFLNYLDRYTLPAVLEPLGRDLALTDAQRGWLGSAFLLSYMVTAPLFGALGDRRSRPRIISLAIAAWSLATASTWLVRSFEGLLCLRAVVGVGEAAYYGLGVAMLCDLVPERQRALKLTWFFLAIPLGSAIGFGLAGVIAEHLGWRASFLVCGLPGLLVALAMWFVKDPERGANDLVADETRDLGFGQRLRFLLTHRVWLATTACYVGYTFAMGALTHWSASFLERVHGVGTGSAGLTFGAMAAVTGIGGTLAGGALTQRLQARHPDIDVHFSSATLVLAAIGVAGYLLLPGLYASLGALFTAMLLLFASTTPINNLTVSSLPASIRAFGASLNVFFIHLLGDAISPAAVGAISDRSGATASSLAHALLVTLPALLLAGLVLLLARRRPSPARG